MPYDLKEPVWNGNIDPEEIRDADEDEQMSQISITSGRYYSVACGPDIEFYKKKLKESRECLNLPDDYDIPNCEWNIKKCPEEGFLKWFRGDEEAFDIGYPYRIDSGESPDDVMYSFAERHGITSNLHCRRPNNLKLKSIEITPELRKELRETRVEFYKNHYEYYMDNGICEAPDEGICVENCCSFEKIDSCYCGFNKNKYACILTPCCRHKMHLRCLYAWKERKETACGGILGRAEDIAEHCPYCRANWVDYGNSFYPAQ